MPLKDIIGQKKAIESLKRSADSERLAHAYLFIGPPGIGKRKTAVEFSKFLNCLNPREDNCGVCTSCIKIEKSAHPDILIIERDENANQISIDKIRELKRRFSLKAFEAKYKTAIILKAETMSDEAFNSLLKMLEEPAYDTIFILTTSSKKALPRTVVSRCQVIRFRSLRKDEVEKILRTYFEVREEEAKLLSAMSSSDVGKALSFKDKGAIEWKNSIIDGFDPHRVSNANSDGNLFMAKRPFQSEALDILVGFFRDILVYKITGQQEMVINIDRLDKIEKLSQSMGIENIQASLNSIDEIKASIEANANTKLAMKLLQERLTV